MDALHVVLGAGQIGHELVSQLVGTGKRVRQVHRRDAAPRAGLEQLAGDLTDLDFARRAGEGASVLYHCVSAPYQDWQRLLPAQNRGVLHAATTSQAPLVVIDNLYMYGSPDGPIREDSPNRPCSKKGVLRARLSDELLEAHRRGQAKVTLARASDFFGPRVVRTMIFGERYFRRVLGGKPGEFIGDPDAPHSYTYVPDVATTMITLGGQTESLGQVWHVPSPPATSTRTMMEQMAAALGVPLRLTRLSEWTLRLGGLFSPLIGEVVEMTYQWKRAFVLDDHRFRTAFGGGHTPLPDALAATAAWARASFA